MIGFYSHAKSFSTALPHILINKDDYSLWTRSMTSSFSITTCLSHVSIGMTTLWFDLMKTESNLTCRFLGKFPFPWNVNCEQERKHEKSPTHFSHVRISRRLSVLGPLPYYNTLSGFLLVQPFHFHNKQRELSSWKTEWKSFCSVSMFSSASCEHFCFSTIHQFAL